MVRDDRSISFTVSSVHDVVHPIVRQAEEFVREFGVDDVSRVSLVLRELLANAIVHGNLNLPTRTVACQIEHVQQRQFRIAVEDEGEGFDLAGLNTTLPDDPRTLAKRGYHLIRNICSAVDSNKRGNRVTVLLSV